MTFAGPPEAVVEGAFQAARRAQELIDMSRHSGTHPRFGALDVCPLVPIAGVSMDETVRWSRLLGQRLGEELGLTVYLYERSATREDRRNLATVRAGGYEGLTEKLEHEKLAPGLRPHQLSTRVPAQPRSEHAIS